MRDKNRIEPFMKELGDIWKENVPDWRFGQLMINIIDDLDDKKIDIFLLEENELIDEIKKLF